MNTPKRKEFRRPRWFATIPLVAAALCAVIAAERNHHQGLAFSTLGFGCLVLLFLAAAVESTLGRVTLAEEALEIVSNFRLRAYPRNSFTSVSWAKGCPIALSARAFSSQVHTSDSSENATKQWIRAFYRFNETVKRSNSTFANRTQIP